MGEGENASKESNSFLMCVRNMFMWDTDSDSLHNPVRMSSMKPLLHWHFSELHEELDTQSELTAQLPPAGTSAHKEHKITTAFSIQSFHMFTKDEVPSSMQGLGVENAFSCSNMPALALTLSPKGTLIKPSIDPLMLQIHYSFFRRIVSFVFPSASKCTAQKAASILLTKTDFVAV